MYSFGVMALEIACGRRTYYQQGEEEEHMSLMSSFMEATDEKLDMKFDRNETKLLLIIRLWCSHLREKEWPNVMPQVQY
ncbi:hypothetical protein TorRG33x02_191810 [Trema orientale]|uniref:Uncharacterized protein n=1 Tax=Trema orientale TaxID=63057 RepID=A0A2P5EHR2_TREOI|nr:hypothetical protein TorRG33x02_191810 [Trema orientale]